MIQEKAQHSEQRLFIAVFFLTEDNGIFLHIYNLFRLIHHIIMLKLYCMYSKKGQKYNCTCLVVNSSTK